MVESSVRSTGSFCFTDLDRPEPIILVESEPVSMEFLSHLLLDIAEFRFDRDESLLSLCCSIMRRSLWPGHKSVR